MSRVRPTKPPEQKPEKGSTGTKAGWHHMNRVKQRPCIICGAPPPSDAHHCRSGGMARDDFKTIPLCRPCHLGRNGYHTRKAFWEKQHGPDYSYLPKVEAALGEVDF